MTGSRDDFLNYLRRYPADRSTAAGRHAYALHFARGLAHLSRKRYRIYWWKTCDGWWPVVAPYAFTPPANRRRDEP